MIIDEDRSELDKALQGPENCLLLTFGESNPKGEDIHATASQVALSQHKPFHIKKTRVLTADEFAEWYKDDQKYTLLSKLQPTFTKRKVVEQMPLDDLNTATGKPSSKKITTAWGRASAG